ncbi:hypothetical protein L5G28_07790 [Gordonia sp. HY285]|nr:hypothetical protein [Gordonia liuliyuniae]MCF8610063.1 hypothetical protein [Gordonia liuliyuniae]
MSEVTVRAVQPVLGLYADAVVTVERTLLIDRHITAGHLIVEQGATDGTR